MDFAINGMMPPMVAAIVHTEMMVRPITMPMSSATEVRAALLAKVEHAAAISSLLQAQGTLPQPTDTFTDISGTR